MALLNTTEQANDVSLSVVHTLRVKVSYTVGSGGVVSIGKVPAMAIVMDAGVVVEEAFNAGTANAMFLGRAGDPDSLATVLDVSLKGRLLANAMATSTTLHNAEDAEYIATLNMTGAAATQGVGYAYLIYAVGND